MNALSFIVFITFVLLSMYVNSREMSMTQQMNSDDLFYGKDSIDNKTLEEIRGGFVAANGLLVNFGVNVKSYYEGQLVRKVEHNLLSSEVKIVKDYGNNTSKILSATPIKNANLEGIVINNGANYTAALHHVSANQIVNMLVQTDSGKTLEQKMDINIEVANFHSFKQTQDGIKLLDRIVQN